MRESKAGKWPGKSAQSSSTERIGIEREIDRNEERESKRESESESESKRESKSESERERSSAEPQYSMYWH